MIKNKKIIKKDSHSFCFKIKLKQNKKGIFVTLSAILILLIIFSFVILSNQQSIEISEVNIQYDKHKVVSDYIGAVENIYLPSLIAISEKYSISNYSNHIMDSLPTNKIKPDLTEIIMTGELSGTEIIPDYLTLPELINDTFHTMSSPVTFKSFDFNITSINHKDEWTIIINSSANFSISAETITGRNYSKITWTNTRNYSTEISIIGLIDVNQEELITSQWKENSTQDCYIKDLNGIYFCDGIEGLCPLSGC